MPPRQLTDAPEQAIPRSVLSSHPQQDGVTAERIDVGSYIGSPSRQVTLRPRQQDGTGASGEMRRTAPSTKLSRMRSPITTVFLTEGDRVPFSELCAIAECLIALGH